MTKIEQSRSAKKVRAKIRDVEQEGISRDTKNAVGGAVRVSDRPGNFDDIVEAFKTRGLDRLVRLELLEMAEGGNPNSIRAVYYPGWTDDDFRALLEELGSPIKAEDRPERPANFHNQVEYYKKWGLNSMIRWQFEDMARGLNPEGIRTQSYPGWTDDDFKALLKELGYPRK